MFRRVKDGFLVYDPFQAQSVPKKHQCPDCSFCQRCAESRCHVCRARKEPRTTMSLREQVVLYDTLNRDLACEEK